MPSMTDFKVWETVEPPKGTVYNYPLRPWHTRSRSLRHPRRRPTSRCRSTTAAIHNQMLARLQAGPDDPAGDRLGAGRARGLHPLNGFARNCNVGLALHVAASAASVWTKARMGQCVLLPVLGAVGGSGPGRLNSAMGRGLVNLIASGAFSGWRGRCVEWRDCCVSRIVAGYSQGVMVARRRASTARPQTP